MRIKHPGFGKVVTGVLLVLFGLFVGLIAIEIILPALQIQGVERYVYQRKRPIVQYIYGQYHSTLGYILRQNLENAHIKYRNYLDYSFQTNANGFRGKDWDVSPGRKNVVVLGDSFAFGWGVEENQTFAALLEKRLRQIDPAVQVLNMAQSGYSLDQILNVYDLYGNSFDPIFIVYLYCFNDPIEPPPFINGEFDYKNFRMKVPRQAWEEEARNNNTNIWRLERSWKGSYVFAFYNNYLLPFFVDKRSSEFRRARKARLTFSYDTLSPPTPPSGPIPRTSIQQQYVWYCLDKLYNDSHKKPLLLMDTSDKVFVHMEDRAESDRWLLRDFAALHQNVFFFDFESELRRRNDGVLRYLNVDDHWNAAGHLLASEMLFSAIEQNLAFFGVGKRQ